MRIVRESTEAEMVLSFLAAELEAPRWGSDVLSSLGDAELVMQANLNREAANGRRREALGRYRGFGRDLYLFRGFPAEVHWSFVELTMQELGAFRYLNLPEFRELSGGTRFVRDGAANVDLVDVPQGSGNLNERVRAVEAAFASGTRYPPLIAAADNDDRHVLLEGHARATAYVRARKPDDVEQLIVGYADDLSGWLFV